MPSNISHMLRRCAIGILCSAGILLPFSGRAQGQAYAPKTGPLSALDTGRMQRGHRVFDRYAVSACDRAAVNVKGYVERHGDRDTLPYDPAHETFPNEAVSVVRACLADRMPRDVRPVELLAFEHAALAAGDDARAHDAAARWVAAAPTREERARRLGELVRMYITMTPARVADAEASAAQLDTMGTGIGSSVVEAHFWLSHYYTDIFDVPNIVREANAAIEAARRQPIAVQDASFLYTLLAYGNLTDATLYEHGPAALSKLGERATTDLGPLLNGEGKSNLSYVMKQVSEAAALIGTTVAPLSAKYRYNVENGDRPSKSRVSLIVSLSHNCGVSCYPAYAALRRWAKAYGPSGLEIIVVDRTQGYSPMSLPQEPAEEAEATRAYMLETQHLDAALLVEETPSSRRADGRRTEGTVSFGKQFGGNTAVLVGRDGKVIWAGRFLASIERHYVRDYFNTTDHMIEAYIRRAVAK